MVTSVAGSGKTTLAIKLAKSIENKSILYLVFGKRN